MVTIPDTKYAALQDIIGKDVGNRGMKALIVPGDLQKASEIFANGLEPNAVVLLLSGFPCCVQYDPPTETDGPPGTVCLAQTALVLGYRVVVLTDACNHAVFQAALQPLLDKQKQQDSPRLSLESFPANVTAEDRQRLEMLARSCRLIIACERAGPGADGHCYTMRGIDMTARGLIAPLHDLIDTRCHRGTGSTAPNADVTPFVAIGDGGNELGMGKVLDCIVNNPQIAQGDKIGCVVAADCLIAASVSNWGGYALAAGAAVSRAHAQHRLYLEQVMQDDKHGTDGNDGMYKQHQDRLTGLMQSYIHQCLPDEQAEIALLERCLAAGSRDGVSGQLEATVDGMPLETSLQCLRDIQSCALQVDGISRL